MKIRKKLLVCPVIILLLVCSMMVSYAADMQDNMRMPLTRAKVLKIVSDETVEIGDYGLATRTQKLELYISEGIHKGEIIQGENTISQELTYQIIVKEGEEVLIGLEEDSNGNIINAFVAEKVRDKYMIWLLVLFFALVLSVGGFKGLKSLISLAITIVLVVKFMLPKLLLGQDPVLLAVITGIVSTVLTIVIIAGFSKKSIASILGSIGGLVCAGIIGYIFTDLASLTGLSMAESQALKYIPQGIEFDFQGLLLAGIILGALGAVMDVSMSISSSLQEIHDATNKEIDVRGLFKSGMNIGKDIMGTMTNTLILAYTGTAMNLMLLFMAHDVPLKEIANRDTIASEIVRGVAGTIGLVFTIPITAIIAAILLKRHKQENN